MNIIIKEKEFLNKPFYIQRANNTEINTVKVENYFLHSFYNPTIEAERIAQKNYELNHLHILIGFGLGHVANVIHSKLNKGDSLLIIEPNALLFKEAINLNQQAPILTDDKVNFYIGSLEDDFDILLKSILVNYIGKIKVIVSPNYNRLYSNYVEEAQIKLNFIFKDMQLELNTVMRFSNTWTENFIANLYKGFMATPFEEIKNKLSCPVIIASGGPSLDKQLPLLKEIQNKAFILCAGSTINSLLQADIRPHAIVTVDGGEANYRHFDLLEIDDIPLMYSLAAHKDIAINHHGPQYLFNGHPNLEESTNRLLGCVLGNIKGGDSVANYCLEIAIKLTTGPICFIGQDLAYTKNQTHAFGNRGMKVLDSTSLANKKTIYIKGYYGNDVISDYVFLGMKQKFEEILSMYKERNVLNATEGGALIKGAQNIAFTDFVQRYCGKDNTEEISQIVFPKCMIKTKDDWELFKKSITDEKEKLMKIRETCTKGLKILNKVDTIKYKFSEKILSKLDKVDSYLLDNMEVNFMVFAYQPTIFRINNMYEEVENETEFEKRKRIYLKTQLMYQDIEKVTSIGEQWLNKLIININSHIKGDI